mmetsp:Transcript_19658/g.61783  ORF Transcript_19658/g.61783 Transcript_19658/m.61783 type:complete len:293 (+) Transcript_19658:309-1187(+)
MSSRSRSASRAWSLGLCAVLALAGLHLKTVDLAAGPRAGKGACSTCWTTPTATVVFWSRTAKRPRGGYSLNGSTHMGAWGLKRTTAASPACSVSGRISRTWPVRRSVLDKSSSKTHGTRAVWHSTHSTHPAPTSPALGGLRMMTWAKKDKHSHAGLSSAAEATMPRRSSFIATSTETLTSSPHAASSRLWWCISMDRTSAGTLPGTRISCVPGLSEPVATRPTTTTPVPPICMYSCSRKRSGLSGRKYDATASSRASISVGPQYQGMFAERQTTLSPIQPEVGTKCTSQWAS